MRKTMILALLLTGACSMNPRLDMPAVPVPASYPDAGAQEPPSAAALDWHEMFGDPRLQKLIELALENNRDLRVAALNVEAARSQFRVARGAQLPQLGLQGAYTRQRVPLETAAAGVGGAAPGGTPAGPSGFEFEQFSANAALTSFEIDLFGRLRSQSQAAFERYLGTEEGRRAARISLIGSVSDAYFNERLAAEQLALTERTLADWRTSLDIARQRRDARQDSGVEVAQAEGQVYQAEADLSGRRRALAECRNALQLLVGTELSSGLPAPIDLMAQPVFTRPSVGMSSDLLTNRPDIRQAERELRAANADVGAARAAFFPRISLTGLFGFTSLAFDNLFKGDNQTWSFSPSLTQPIFNGGSLRGSLKLAEVRKSIAVAQYERAIQAAFREVADGIAGRETFGGQITSTSAALAAADNRVKLSNLRYRAGLDSRLELLDAQRSRYAVQQTLLDLRRQELSSAAGLFRALGGGDSSGPVGR